jgi:hypothetical protein
MRRQFTRGGGRDFYRELKETANGREKHVRVAAEEKCGSELKQQRMNTRQNSIDRQSFCGNRVHSHRWPAVPFAVSFNSREFPPPIFWCRTQNIQGRAKAVEPLGRAQWREIRITAFCMKQASGGCKPTDSSLDSPSKTDIQNQKQNVVLPNPLPPIRCCFNSLPIPPHSTSLKNDR